MKTSYFHKSWREPTAVSIALKHPPHYHGREYPKLAPSRELVYADIPWADYVRIYQQTVLNQLDPKTVYQELGEDAVLLCWEGPSKQCHRHLVASWLEENLGIRVEELTASGPFPSPQKERFRQMKLV